MRAIGLGERVHVHRQMWRPFGTLASERGPYRLLLWSKSRLRQCLQVECTFRTFAPLVGTQERRWFTERIASAGIQTKPISYLLIIVDFVSPSSKYSSHSCVRTRSQRLACRILRELAREPLLIFELLNAGVAEYLSRLLPKLRETSIDRLLEVRNAIHSTRFILV